MSYQKEVFTRYADSPSIDACGRARVSEPVSIFDYKSIYSLQSELWESETIGGGSSITHLPNEAAVLLTAGSGSASALIQTYRYFPYVPGRSLFIVLTGVLGAKADDVVRRIGLFDDNNGLFFELNGQELRVVRRTKTNGNVVDNWVRQSEWNLNTMDGNGEGGIVLDTSKAQIFVIDFQWLGVGRIRFGFNIGGEIIYCHEMLHTNIIDTVFMSTPTLPMRYEITKTAGAAATLKSICCAISSEAGYLPPGTVHSESNKNSLRGSISAKTPIFAIRLKNTFHTVANRRTAYLVDASALITGNNALVEIVHVHSDYSSVTGNWTSVGDDSACEYSTDISAITGGTAHVLGSAYVAAGTGQGNSPPPSSVNPRGTFINNSSFISQNKASNKSQLIVIYATPMAENISAAGTLTWTEFE